VISNDDSSGLPPVNHCCAAARVLVQMLPAKSAQGVFQHDRPNSGHTGGRSHQTVL